MDVKMHQGDTGSFTLRAVKASGNDWTPDDRLVFTIAQEDWTIKLSRYYRLDDERTIDLGNGVAVIEFRNSDTDEWATGNYKMEVRYGISPVWDGENIPEDDMIDATRTDIAHICEGATVRTKIQSVLTIDRVYWRI
jgi:hypothetical protein